MRKRERRERARANRDMTVTSSDIRDNQMASMDMAFDSMKRRNYGTESVKDILDQQEQSYAV